MLVLDPSLILRDHLTRKLDRLLLSKAGPEIGIRLVRVVVFCLLLLSLI